MIDFVVNIRIWIGIKKVRMLFVVKYNLKFLIFMVLSMMKFYKN